MEAKAARSCGSGIVLTSGQTRKQGWAVILKIFPPIHLQNTHKMSGKEEREEQRTCEWQRQARLGKGMLGGFRSAQGRPHQKATELKVDRTKRQQTVRQTGAQRFAWDPRDI